jgi:hypothetical protein
MRYVLRKRVLGSVPELEISHDEFLNLAAAREVLTNAFAIEEKYEIVLSNLLDLEKELLSLAAAEILRRPWDYSGFYAVRAVLNVRMVNLLTATKLYLDQLPQHVSKCLPTCADANEKIRSYCSEEYDSRFEYRFMEALRNYVQHRGVPVHSTSHGASWTSHEADGSLEYCVDIAAQRIYLEEDGKFKRSVLSEISDDVVDLKASARAYIESISTINDRARELIEDTAKQARTTIERSHERYAAVHNDTLVGLAALELDEGNHMKRSIPLLLEWDDVRLELQKRNRRLRNLVRQYVTGKARIVEKQKVRKA